MPEERHPDARRKRRLGILGGMGPEATVLMMSRIVQRTAASDDCDHIPMLVDCNTQVPSRIDAIVKGVGPDPGAVLVSMAQRLEAAGVDGLVMPCNTAHLYADQIAGAVAIPFLDMVMLSAEKLAANAGVGGRVGVLASPAVVQTGLYDRALRRCGLAAVYPPDGDAMLPAIRAVKAGSAGAHEHAAVQSASEALMAAGAGVIAVACTELSVLRSAIIADVPVVDALDVLVDAAIGFATQPAGMAAPGAALPA